MGNECGIGGEGKGGEVRSARTSDGLLWPDNKAIPFARPLSYNAVGLKGHCMHTYCMESGTLTSAIIYCALPGIPFANHQKLVPRIVDVK